MSLNPIAILDSILADYASPRVRRLIHSLITLAVALVTVYLAVNGDWEQFAVSLAATIYAAANKANTHPVEEREFYDGEPEDDEDDGVSGNLPLFE